MKIVVTGATGNVGTSVLEALAKDDSITEVIGLARRRPKISVPKCTFAIADVAEDDLTQWFLGAAAVIHLAWMIQPSRNVDLLHHTNVVGSQRVFRAAADADVPALVYASSFGTYGPGPKDRYVDESWSNVGVQTCLYSRQKALVERHLDRFEHEHPEIRVVRMRPGLILKRSAASELKRLWVGKLVPSRLLGPHRIPFVPLTDRLMFQAMHGQDAGEAYRLAAISDVRGPFNLAAGPVLDSRVIAQTLGARLIPIREKTLRRMAALSYRLHMQPVEPGFLDLAFQLPLMDTTRARAELGFTPQYSATEAMLEALQGMEDREGMQTAPLHPLRQPV